ncbi:hypothetical protein GUJ93_ZPchr0001g31166 [Zizania palustris]|uniref:Bifunctional inhibitor/plant lipid transfer protein/seed storage helical domain-containing protein n=1 Tax=Zizania palustris TaxID=103762 RepID=A0A8J5R7V6_ZIZPA|nr:hypothetical protein GUJ93_ZPchr0001g31166 [Zizania palustris]
MQTMAPPSKLIAFVLAFVAVVVAATLQPAAAGRVQGFGQEATAARSSKTFVVANGGAQQPPFPFLFPLPVLPFPGGPGSTGSTPPSQQQQPSFPGFSFPLIIPGLPFPIPLFFPPLFPMPGAPATPGAPPSPSSQPQPSPPQPTQCMTPLMAVIPCADYLTNATVLTPPSTCCDGFKSLVNTAPICLCHGMNGDLNSFLPKPVDPMKMMMLPLTCGTLPPLQTLFMCNTQAVPPLFPPKLPAAASPPVSA